MTSLATANEGFGVCSPDEESGFSQDLGKALRRYDQVSRGNLAAGTGTVRFLRESREKGEKDFRTVVNFISVPYALPKLEALYPRLGGTRGPDGNREARQSAVRAFASHGSFAAEWLASRMSTERNLDKLAGATEALIALGGQAVEEALGRTESAHPDGRRAFLRALAHMPLEGYEESALAAASKALESEDVDLREAAYELLGALNFPAATALLNQKATVEPSPDLRELISDLLRSGR